MAVNTGAKVNGRRVAVVAGLRTPFVKSGTVFKDLTALDLATRVVSELVQRADLDPELVDQVVYGQVIPAIETPNIAREVVLGTGLPRHIEAYSVVRACATSTQAFVSAAQNILLGQADVAIVGGAESLSRPPVRFQDAFVDALMAANAAKDPMSKLKAFSDIKPKDLLPKAPAIAEFSTGMSMGESAEKMAKENGIRREDQDAFALRSHRKSTEAWEKGIYEEEVMHFPVGPGFKNVVDKDNLIRPDTSLEKLSSLKPVFDRKYGSVTAGNSSPLTDGASALLVMEESRARELGYEPLAFLTSWAFVGLDPAWQLLMGPSFATPKALDRAGLKLDDLDLIDMHEAFSAQMLSNMQAFKSKEWAQKHLGRDEPVGEIPDEKLNIYGGSVSLGHPFAATGARQILTMSKELARRGSGKALVTQCAAGGLGAAVILER